MVPNVYPARRTDSDTKRIVETRFFRFSVRKAFNHVTRDLADFTGWADGANAIVEIICNVEVTRTVECNCAGGVERGVLPYAVGEAEFPIPCQRRHPSIVRYLTDAAIALISYKNVALGIDSDSDGNIELCILGVAIDKSIVAIARQG